MPQKVGRVKNVSAKDFLFSQVLRRQADLRQVQGLQGAGGVPGRPLLLLRVARIRLQGLLHKTERGGRSDNRQNLR